MQQYGYTFLLLILTVVSCRQPDEPLEYEWHEAEGYRWSNLSVDQGDRTGFVEKTSSELGLSFTNYLPQEDIYSNRHYLNGSGVALGDVDGDGWTDIYFARLNGPNKLYKNLGGLRFEDITEAAGVAHEDYYSTGVVFADIDGDGDLDLLVTSMEQENVIYLNDGRGTFSRKDDSILSKSLGSHTLALADIDDDGDLDLYLTNYKEDNVLDLFHVRDLSWERTVREPYDPNADRTYTLVPPFDDHYTILYNRDGPPERREVGRKDELFINSGDGTFVKAEDAEARFLDSEGNPKGLEPDWGLTAKFHDINNDGLPDLYVCNDFWTKDRIWINQGGGVFRDMDPMKIRNMSFSAMGVDFSDVNRDGYWDFFITEMLNQHHSGRLRQFIPDDPHPNYDGQYDNQPQYNRNSFYLNRGDDTFAEISYFSGLEASGWSWATRFLDVDLDGYEDLLVTTGYTYDVQDLDAQEEWRNEISRSSEKRSHIDIYPSLKEPNKLFRNNGDNRFEDVSSDWGFTEDDVSHGLATADLDHDGDLDLVINRLNQEAAVYQNSATSARIAVRLTGKKPNTQAIGAKIELRGGPVPQQDEISAGGDYLSHSDALTVFAADEENDNHQLVVTWPGGERSVIESVQANRIYEVDQRSVPMQDREIDVEESTGETIFEDISEVINHRHHEEPYDDFRIQPLLPVKLSRQGPGISSIDVDSDGDDDLIISTGRGGQVGVFENNGNGSFKPMNGGELTQESPSDKTAIIGWREENFTRLLVGNANYEPGDIDTPSALHYTYRNGRMLRDGDIPGIFSTTGALAAADYDGNGTLDLFVGGRFIPAHYPMDPDSRLFKKIAGRYVQDDQNTAKFERIGMVTAAVFTDYDLDGDPDLLLSLEWGSLRLFENRDAVFVDVTNSVGLDRYKGWWNGVATGDFNNDGRPDIIATNIGLNSPYQLENGHPLKMYYQDFNRDGRVDIIESYFDPVTAAYVPRRQLQEFESISGIFSSLINSNKDFSEGSLDQILGYPADSRIPYKTVNTLKHTVFINEGDSFSARPLPDEAQFSAAFYAGVADFDNDGNEDLFLSQNFFQVRENRPRLDGGRGLWLKGDGEGNFEAVPGQQSGVEVYGEQRGAALSDFNNDGKVDLAVSQNAAETRLFRNKTAREGFSIRLEGPAENRDAIGSSIRMVYEDGTKGPKREIQAGSGYWSQNSFKQVMGSNIDKVASQIEVIWFDGRSEVIDLIPDGLQYTITYPAD